VHLSGETGDVDEYGRPVRDDHVTLLLNAHHEPIPFVLPSVAGYSDWEKLIDTADPKSNPSHYRGRDKYPLAGRSMAVFRASRRTGS
jgi:glycogen operon protein